MKTVIAALAATILSGCAVYPGGYYGTYSTVEITPYIVPPPLYISPYTGMWVVPHYRHYWGHRHGHGYRRH